MTNPKSASRFSTAPRNYTKFPNKLLHATSLNAVEKIIIAYIGSVAVCYASQRRFSEICDVSIDTVRRSIRKLEQKKIIEVRTRPGSTAIFKILASGEWDLTPSKSSEVGAEGAVNTPSKSTPTPLANPATINSIPIKNNLERAFFSVGDLVECIDASLDANLKPGGEYVVETLLHRSTFIKLKDVNGTFAWSRFQRKGEINEQEKE